MIQCQALEGRDVQRGHGGHAVELGAPQREAVQAVVMHDVEARRIDRRAGPLEAGVDMGVEGRAALVLQPGISPLVVLREDGLDAEARIAVAAGEQGHLVAALFQPRGEVEGVRLHPAHEGLDDRLTHVRHDRDPHAAILMPRSSCRIPHAGTAARSMRAAVSASMRRITVVVLA